MTLDRKRAPRRGGRIEQLAPGRWKVIAEADPDTLTGKRRRVTRTVEGTRLDAERALAELVAKRGKGGLAGTNDLTVGELLDWWHERTLGRRPSTVVNEASAIRAQLKPRLGSKRLARLTRKDIDTALRQMVADGLANRTVNRVANVLSRALDVAVDEDLIPSNPARLVRMKQIAPVGTWRPEAPDDDVVLAALKHCATADPDLLDFVLTVAATGARRGEIAALRWSDVDPSRQTAVIRNALSDGGGKRTGGPGVVLGPTKNERVREVALPADLAERLAARRQRLADHGATPTEIRAMFVFAPDGDLGLPRPDSYTERWRKARGPHTVTFRDLRHWVATNLLRDGTAIPLAADMLGHSPAVLLRHYAAGVTADKRDAANRHGSRLRGIE